jgi:hypothetical protein
VAQRVERLPSKHDALRSNSIIRKKEGKEREGKKREREEKKKRKQGQ